MRILLCLSLVFIYNTADCCSCRNKTADMDECIEKSLRLAAKSGDHKKVRNLLEYSTDLNKLFPVKYEPNLRKMKTIKSKTTILIESIFGGIKTTQELLNNGANPNTTDINTISPLQWAVIMGKTDIVNLLLSSGAKINYRSNLDILFAAKIGVRFRSRRKNFFGRMITHKRTLKGKGHSALILAAFFGDYFLIKNVLLKYKPDINLQNTKGRTALMIAAKYGYEDTVKLLIKSGANCFLTDKSGKKAIKYARSQRISDLILLGSLKNKEDVGSIFIEEESSDDEDLPPPYVEPT